eukprot:CAMPEP_0170595988 /NCGR_PEP_ID=MMETSP0224-20130122/14862_1 /TAXON_ID=285029 /ORGANISM="Togula jolla, Strain CCCM 725" /LENGTH=567 /DNA_ID=CAMNT_0010920219 /DNA_START=55 /DNA_END=1758 /DNA_ORIENTATION=-
MAFLLCVLAFWASMCSAQTCKDILGDPVVPHSILTPAEQNCWHNLLWAKDVGIYAQSRWYSPHGLTPKSSLADFQYFLYNNSGNGVGPSYDCLLPCSSHFALTATATPLALPTFAYTKVGSSVSDSRVMVASGEDGSLGMGSVPALDDGMSCKDVVGPPFSHGTKLTALEENCWVNLQWAMSNHMAEGWYVDHELSPYSPLLALQWALHDSSDKCIGPHRLCPCPAPCTRPSTTTSSTTQMSSAVSCRDVVGPPLATGVVLTPKENNCWFNLLWAKNTGVHEKNWWYAPHGLTPQSPYADFQYFLYNKSGNGVGPTYDCFLPCTSSFTSEVHGLQATRPHVGLSETLAEPPSWVQDHVLLKSSQGSICKDIVGPPDAPDAQLTPMEQNCWVTLQWAKNAEMTPEWYKEHGLSPTSSLADYQELLHSSGLHGCSLPCRDAEAVVPEASVTPRMWSSIWTLVFLCSIGLGLLAAQICVLTLSMRNFRKSPRGDSSAIDEELADSEEDLAAAPWPVPPPMEQRPAFQHVPVPHQGPGYLRAPALASGQVVAQPWHQPLAGSVIAWAPLRQ